MTTATWGLETQSQLALWGVFDTNSTRLARFSARYESTLDAVSLDTPHLARIVSVKAKAQHVIIYRLHPPHTLSREYSSRLYLYTRLNQINTSFEHGPRREPRTAPRWPPEPRDGGCRQQPAKSPLEQKHVLMLFSIRSVYVG